MHRSTKSIILPNIGQIILKKNVRARRLRISIKDESHVGVSVPIHVSFHNAEEFVRLKSSWILKSIKHIKGKIKLDDVDRQEARKKLKHKLDSLCIKYKFDYNKLSIRNQKTRWGSCSAENNISLNSKIINLPEELIEYILMHELVHTKIKNHSKEFWDTLDLYIPSPKNLDKKLRKYLL